MCEDAEAREAALADEIRLRCAAPAAYFVDLEGDDAFRAACDAAEPTRTRGR